MGKYFNIKELSYSRIAAEKGINCAGEWTDPMTAVKRSLADGTDTICCGSLFLCGLIKERQNEF